MNKVVSLTRRKRRASTQRAGVQLQLIVHRKTDPRRLIQVLDFHTMKVQRITPLPPPPLHSEKKHEHSRPQ